LQYGAKGLVSKKRGHASNRKFTDILKSQVKTLLTSRYIDFGPTFAAEKLLENHLIKVSKETLRQ